MPDDKNILDSALDLLEGGLDAFDNIASREERESRPPSGVIDVGPACQLCEGERYMQEDDGSFQPCPLCNPKFKNTKRLDSGPKP